MLLENLQFKPEDYLNNGGDMNTLLWINDFSNRVIRFNQEVDSDTVVEPLLAIQEFNRLDAGKPVEERVPVKLYIDSIGGEIDSGFALIDTIIASETPVYTITTGAAYSMAFLIAIAGKKRFSLKHSKFLIHDGSISASGSLGKVQDETAFTRKITSQMREFILEYTKISKKEYDKKQRFEWFLTAEQAKSKGVVDYIVGEDCQFSDIL